MKQPKGCWVDGSKGVLASAVLLLVGLFTGAAQVGADGFLDQVNAELEKLDRVDGASPPSSERKVAAGDGFTDGLDYDQFGESIKDAHPGGHILYRRLSEEERKRIFADHYLRGASYQEVLDTMARWLSSR